MDIEYWDAIAETYGADVAQGMLGDRPRPTKPPAPEWDGEGLPPVGIECEINLYGYWKAATVLAYGKARFLYDISPGQVDDEGDEIAGEHDGFIGQAKFRPLKSKAERQREELEDYVYNKVNMAPMSMSAVDAAIDAAA